MKASPPIIAVIVALVLTLAFWFLLYKPANEQQALLEAETLTLVEEQNRLNQELAELRDIKAREVEIRAAIARLDQFIPSGPAQPAAIRQLQEAADAAGAAVTLVGFGEPQVPDAAATGTTPEAATGGTLANIPVNMSVEGGYFQIVDFFRRLEVEVPRAVLVDTVNISEAAAGYPRLKVDWAGQLFSVVTESQLVDTDTGAGVPGATPTPTPTPTVSPSPAGGDQ